MTANYCVFQSPKQLVRFLSNKSISKYIIDKIYIHSKEPVILLKNDLIEEEIVEICVVAAKHGGDHCPLDDDREFRKHGHFKTFKGQEFKIDDSILENMEYSIEDGHN